MAGAAAAAAALTACGGSSASSTSTASSAAASTASSAAEGGEKIVKVALTCDTGTIDDESFNQACWTAVSGYMGDDCQYYIPEADASDEDRETMIRQAVNDGVHLEKQSYDKAVNDIKNVFNLMRIQFQRVQEAMRQIRRNALSYSVDEYEEVLVGNLNTITDTKKKFQEYKTVIQERVKDLEEENINIRKLSKKEQQDLNNLRVIEEYLTRVLDEHQKILNSHFDLKILYTEELERLSQARLIQRFSMRRDLYDKVLKQADTLENMDMFLRPLFNRNPEKIYNLNKAFSYEKSVNAGMEKDTEEEVDFDEEAFRREKEEKLQKKLLVYEKSLQYLLEKASVTGEVSLGQLKDRLDIYPEEKEIFIPNVDVFKEIMVELIRNRTIDIATLKKERREYIQEQPDGFQLNEMILKLVEEQPENNDITSIEVERLENEEAITFSEIKDEENRRKTIRCSNVLIRIFRK